MQDLSLTTETIECVKTQVVGQIKELIKDDLVRIIMYGSCARGDFNEDSDIDIAITADEPSF